MADQPAFKVARGRLWVELKGKDRLSETESLVVANRRGGKQLGSWRKVKGVAMPMENGHTLEISDGTVYSRLRQRERVPTDLFCRPRIHAGSQATSKQLSAQANPNGWPLGIQPPLDKRDLVRKERIFSLFVYSNWGSQNDEQITIRYCEAAKVVYSRVAIPNLVAVGHEDGFKRTEVFELDVANGRYAFHERRPAL